MWLTKRHIDTTLLCGLMLLTLLAGCKSKNSQDVVAKVFSNSLYLKDLDGIVPPGISPEDSAVIADNYVDQWIQEMVLLEKARRNVDNDFETELRNYKNSLITYTYERQIVEQLLDTNVSEEQVTDYYNAHKDNFGLNTSIVKAIYVKMPQANSPNLLKLKATMSKKTLTDEDIVAIQQLSTGCISASLDYQTWRPFFQIQSEIPAPTANEASMLRSTQLQTFSNDSVISLLRILDRKMVGELSPIEMEYEYIKDIILNGRAVDIINSMRIDLRKEAEIDGNIIIYNRK